MPTPPLTLNFIKAASYAELMYHCGHEWGGWSFIHCRWVDPTEAKEDPSIWIEIVEDHNLLPWRRGFGVVQYFMRHAIHKPLASVVADKTVASWFKGKHLHLVSSSGPPLYDMSRENTCQCRIDIKIGRKVSVGICMLLEPGLDDFENDERMLKRAFATGLVDARFKIVELACFYEIREIEMVQTWMHVWTQQWYSRTKAFKRNQTLD